MRHRLLEDIALMHRDALEADQKSPKTLRFYEQRQEMAIRDLERLAARRRRLTGSTPTCSAGAIARSPGASAAAGGAGRRTCCQFRPEAGWESSMVREGLVAAEERVTGRVI